MRRMLVWLTAAVFLASTALPAAAGGRHYRGGHGYSLGYKVYGGHHRHFGPKFRHHGHRFRHHGHRHHGHGALIVGALAGGIVLGHLLTRPSYAAPPAYAAPVYAPPLGNCVGTTGQGTWYGRPALFGGTMCYDPAGRPHILQNSVRFLHYL